MKILHVDPAPSWRGGERQVHLLAKMLERRGLESVVVAAPDGPLARRCEADRLRVIPCAMRGDMDAGAVWRMLRTIRHERPDVIHLHTARAHAVGGMASRLAAAGPVLVTRRLELPPRGAIGRWKYSWLADHYIAITGAVEESLRRGGVESRRITRIPSGVVIPPEVPPPPPGEWVVGTLAAMTPQKDPWTWVRTVARVLQEDPGVRFVWAGEGELRGTLEGAIREAGVADRVEILPFQEDPEPVWRRLSAFFLPSAFEALGTVLLDALARGLPVVASRAGGIPEVVRDGREGLLADPGDDASLSAALRRIRSDRKLAKQLGSAGRERARDFEIGGVVDRIAELYSRLAEGGGE